MSRVYFGSTHYEFSKLFQKAQSDIIILCPYIKLEALKQILSSVKDDVSVSVVVRWKLEDLVFGSSDLEVFNYLKKLNHKLYINQKIHLKVAVVDGRDIIVGSANITSAGLGFAKYPNIEAIIVDEGATNFMEGVRSIIDSSGLVDIDLYNYICDKVKSLEDVKVVSSEIDSKIESLDDFQRAPYFQSITLEDFPFTYNPGDLLVDTLQMDEHEDYAHDLALFSAPGEEMSKEVLKKAFLSSKAYAWQKRTVVEDTLFGRYSEILHDAVGNNERVYRKDVKRIVENMFNWTKEFSSEFEVVEHEHTSSLRRK